MPESHQPLHYHTDQEALAATSASIRDVKYVIEGSLHTIRETKQLLAWIDTLFSSENRRRCER
jgi:hypothetical protein